MQTLRAEAACLDCELDTCPRGPHQHAHRLVAGSDVTHMCMYVCLHLYIHTHTHMYMYACIHTNAKMLYMLIQSCGACIIHMHTYIHTCIHTYKHTHTCIHTYMHTHMHTYIHSYTHARMNMYNPMRLCKQPPKCVCSLSLLFDETF
jgi:hypothetical protein